jgi:hypothetical protein
MKSKTLSPDFSESLSLAMPSASRSELEPQLREYLVRRSEGVEMPKVLKEIQASFAIEGMAVSDEQLAVAARKFLRLAESGEVNKIIAQGKAKFGA